MRHSTTLINKLLPTPSFKNTATGGRMIANMIRIILFMKCFPFVVDEVTLIIS